ncbi:serine/threonine protein kinase [Frigoribacterium sp. CFBP 8754]|uniref:serine/threonine-protein kinase n=1 Tax=Frigoribacterium sp. CFBP 8754 TaxID=2775290 RepID=UPI001786AB3B|nr:serine/threonine protein kinase [Frigoribacterium sp. CFBP 8754]
MARRLPSTPPVLPGFSSVHVLGSGGFADVFLYEQNMPRRQVAVKVMLSEVVNDQVRQMFQAEANLMAQLSSHPSILTVYQASVSADGRPYLVMELCSSSLSERYRRDRIPVADVLRIGVAIGSAVETAHRAGVLHRDIKPSNILMTAYGHPVLSDFGIAASLSESEPQEVVGMSIPWSAPEVLLDETAGTVESEVWSLGATVYSLLAGRSPFEILGSDKNGASELIGRIDKAKLVPTGRTDVPPSLERILARSMSRRPEQRQSSVLELLRELQQVESEVGVGQTPIEVAVDDWALATVTDLEEKTRLRGASPVVATRRRRRRRRQVTEAQAAAVHGPRAGVGARSPAGPGQSRALLRSTGTRPARRDRRVLALVWLLVAAGVVVIALGATATLVLVRATSTEIPRVTGISTSGDGTSVVFSWSDPGPRPGDSYVITTGDDSSQQTVGRFVASPSDPDAEVCVTVSVNRGGRSGEPSAETCATVGRTP